MIRGDMYERKISQKNNKDNRPPLPKANIIAKVPDIYCLDFLGKTRKKCDEYNKE